MRKVFSLLQMTFVSVEVTHAIKRSKGEDRHSAHTFEHGGRILHVLTICDGHGGADAAESAVDVLPREFRQALRMNAETSMRDACRAAFAMAATKLERERSGCAATMCIFAEARVICANVGDVEAMLVPRGARPMMLTTSHAFHASPDERSRLAGLHVQTRVAKNVDGIFGGPMRAWPGGLAMGRALGDADCPYVSSVPSVSETDLWEPSVLVLASDGLWDALPRHRIVERALSKRCASALVDRAWQASTADDITCFVASFGLVPPVSLFGTRKDSSSSLSSLDGEEAELPARTVLRVKTDGLL